METAVQTERAWRVMRPAQRGRDGRHLGVPAPGKTLWIEVKRPYGGVQSDAQKLFERFVTGIGHTYVIATSVEDVHETISRLTETSGSS